jgi:cytochrome oxidase Cu insertion factor (SCO1/SenC/PrrC family)
VRKVLAASMVIALSVLAVPALASTSLPSMTPPPISGTAAKMGGTMFDAPMPALVANTKLTDTKGRIFSLASLKGKYVVLTDFFTSCDDICPLISINMRDIGDAIKKAGLSKSATVLELTIDPQRDTVARLKAYQSLFGDASWTMATGGKNSLKNFWGWFGVYTQLQKKSGKSSLDWQTGKPITYDVIHDDVVILIGPNGHWRWLELGNPQISNPTTLPKTLKSYLSSQGRLNLVKQAQPTWTTGAIYGALQQIFNLHIGPKMKL